MLDTFRGFAYLERHVKGSSDRRIARRPVLRHDDGPPSGAGVPSLNRDLRDLYSPHDESHAVGKGLFVCLR